MRQEPSAPMTLRHPPTVNELSPAKEGDQDLLCLMPFFVCMCLSYLNLNLDSEIHAQFKFRNGGLYWVIIMDYGIHPLMSHWERKGDLGETSTCTLFPQMAVAHRCSFSHTS